MSRKPSPPVQLRFVDSETEQPVARPEVWLNGARLTTSESGAFEIPAELRGSEIELLVRAFPFLTQCSSVRLDGESCLTVALVRLPPADAWIG